MFDIKTELDKLPKQPGVYLMHDAQDNIIYVGKAINLYNRVRSYFRASVPHTAKINKMISLIDHFEYIVVDSDLEAFVLENNLIKEHNPKYNTLLKDSKTYPYIRVSVNEDYPRLMKVRQTSKDKARYFGPYTSEFAVAQILELLNDAYSIRTCNRKVAFSKPHNERPCLNYHMGKCLAPCTGKVSIEEYRKNVDAAIDFINGNDKTILKELKERMDKASENLEFEEAIRLRDLIESARKIIERQKISNPDEEDRDVIAIAKDENDAVAQVFFVRNGKMIGREHYHIGEIEEMDAREILTEFVKRYYTGTPFVPKEVMLPFEIDDIEVFEQWLSSIKGSKCKIVVPKVGAKEKLVELAANNARIVLKQDKDKIIQEEKKTIGALNELRKLLSLDNVVRIEAFDISNTNGFENVGSMVVYENGKALKSDYRKFRIKSVEGPDDYSCMHEVLSRRFLHGFEERKSLEAANLEADYGGFSRFPDLILMDGGRGQVNIAKSVCEELHINIPICGMVKDDHHRTRGLFVDGVEIDIDTHSEAFKLITRIQDEAHRFAIEYHKSLRSKKQVKSILDDIEGVGPARRNALMRSFDSLEDIKNASIEQLCQVEEIPEYVAEKIYNFFH
ncbi:MAG: excinuclease ABC subunit UvrC [Lachnospiraceae bacterium]|nr:excinuclease ABC subunit UvrC [Lachnospiraceae bacterium]